MAPRTRQRDSAAPRNLTQPAWQLPSHLPIFAPQTKYSLPLPLLGSLPQPTVLENRLHHAIARCLQATNQHLPPSTVYGGASACASKRSPAASPQGRAQTPLLTAAAPALRGKRRPAPPQRAAPVRQLGRRARNGGWRYNPSTLLGLAGPGAHPVLVNHVRDHHELAIVHAVVDKRNATNLHIPRERHRCVPVLPSPSSAGGTTRPAGGLALCARAGRGVGLVCRVPPRTRSKRLDGPRGAVTQTWNSDCWTRAHWRRCERCCGGLGPLTATTRRWST